MISSNQQSLSEFAWSQWLHRLFLVCSWSAASQHPTDSLINHPDLEILPLGPLLQELALHVHHSVTSAASGSSEEIMLYKNFHQKQHITASDSWEGASENSIDFQAWRANRLWNDALIKPGIMISSSITQMKNNLSLSVSLLSLSNCGPRSAPVNRLFGGKSIVSPTHWLVTFWGDSIWMPQLRSVSQDFVQTEELRLYHAGGWLAAWSAALTQQCYLNSCFSAAWTVRQHEIKWIIYSSQSRYENSVKNISIFKS